MGRLASLDLDAPCLGHMTESAGSSAARSNPTRALQSLGKDKQEQLLALLIAGKVVKQYIA